MSELIHYPEFKRCMIRFKNKSPFVHVREMSASREIHKSDLICIKSTLNSRKTSTFKVSKKFWENKKSKCG